MITDGLWSFLGTSANAAAQIAAAKSTNQTNREIAELNRQATLTANRENIAFQQKENDMTRLREDNAVQRAALDMQKAGLSKTLAAGSPASAASLAAPQVQAATLNHKEENLLKNVDLASTFTGLMQAIANVKKTEAETTAINTSNQFAFDKAKAELDLTNAKVSATVADARLSKIYGDNALAKIQFEIDNLLSNTNKNYEQIANLVAERLHIRKEDEYLIEQIAKTKAETDTWKWNLALAKNSGISTGDKPWTLFGLPVGKWIRDFNISNGNQKVFVPSSDFNWLD